MNLPEGSGASKSFGFLSLLTAGPPRVPEARCRNGVRSSETTPFGIDWEHADIKTFTRSLGRACNLAPLLVAERHLAQRYCARQRFRQAYVPTPSFRLVHRCQLCGAGTAAEQQVEQLDLCSCKHGTHLGSRLVTDVLWRALFWADGNHVYRNQNGRAQGRACGRSPPAVEECPLLSGRRCCRSIRTAARNASQEHGGAPGHEYIRLLVLHLSAGATAVYPLDIAKTQLQMDKSGKFTGALHVCA